MFELIIVVISIGLFISVLFIISYLKITNGGELDFLAKRNDRLNKVIDKEQLELWEEDYIDLFKKQLL